MPLQNFSWLEIKKPFSAFTNQEKVLNPLNPIFMGMFLRHCNQCRKPSPTFFFHEITYYYILNTVEHPRLPLWRKL